MDANSLELAHRKPDLACDSGATVSVVGSCHGIAVVPASAVKDYYRGYALVAIPTIAITAAAGIVYLALELLF